MHKKIQKLRARIKELTAQAEALAQEEFDTTEAMEQNTQKIEDINKQVEAINGQIEALTKAAKVSQAAARADDDAASAGEVEDGEESDTDDEPGEGVAEDAVQNRKTRSWAKAVKQFAAAARRGFRAEATPTPNYPREGSDPDGGYTVPEDIVTRVEELKASKRSLRDLVSVETVKTNSGRRTFKKRSQQTGFIEVGEGGVIPQKSGPLFSVINYIIRKFAGWLPITNELLADSDANIVDTMTRWMADEGRVTDNVQILAAIKKDKTPVVLTGLDALAKAVLVGLDGAFRSTSKIVTNSNGIFWLATLKDANGRPLLNPVPSEPGKMQLAFGAVVVPVEEFPNADLPDHAKGKPPFIIGDLKEGIRLFDRQAPSIKTSDVAVAGGINAYEQDMTMLRYIERMDVRQRDDEAYIYAYLDTDATDDAPAALGELTVASAAGATSGTTALTVSPDKGATSVYKYNVAAGATAVTAGQNVSSWSVWDGTSDITAETGKVITVVEASADYKALKAGTATVTAKA